MSDPNRSSQFCIQIVLHMCCFQSSFNTVLPNLEIQMQTFAIDGNNYNNEHINVLINFKYKGHRILSQKS